MSSSAAPIGDAPVDASATVTENAPVSSPGKGKGKAPADESMEEDEEEDDDDDDSDDDEEEDEDEEEEEDMSEIDPSAILPRSRRAATRVDYASEEALAKAGLTKAELQEDDEAMES